VKTNQDHHKGTKIMTKNNINSIFYYDEISQTLPPEILDFHTHTWSSEDWKFKPWETQKDGGSYMVCEENYPPEKLLADGQQCFPDKQYRAVVFGYPTPAVDLEKDIRFVASAAKKHKNLYPLIMAGKDFKVPQEQLKEQLRSGGFFGYKVFMNWMGDDYGNVSIEDMLSDNEMALADELRLIVLLHVPRAGRLADPEIQRGVQWLSKEYPNAQIVLAHCGRCYLPAEMQKAVDSVKGLSNVYMDTSMVMDPLTLQIAMEAMEPISPLRQ
jgi:predicted TIM-barrel fold metal-dependent hydrolase